MSDREERDYAYNKGWEVGESVGRINAAADVDRLQTQLNAGDVGDIQNRGVEINRLRSLRDKLMQQVEELTPIAARAHTAERELAEAREKSRWNEAVGRLAVEVTVRRAILNQNGEEHPSTTVVTAAVEQALALARVAAWNYCEAARKGEGE